MDIAAVSPVTESQVQSAAPAVTEQQAQVALAQIQGALPRTRFTAAWPAQFPGLVALQMDDGRVGYTDKNGRYFVFGLILDTATGQALDKQLDGHHKQSE